MISLDSSNWHDFEIQKLFRIEAPGKRSIKEYNEGEVPYVSSGSINNGISSYKEPKKGEVLEKGGCITVSPLDGSSFYQEKDFLGRGGAGSAISLLYNENLNLYNGIFICTIIKICAKKFDYNDALTGNNLKTLVIKLPIQYNQDDTPFVDNSKEYSEDGYIPDWSFMESYMRSVEPKAQVRINHLKKL